MDESARWAAFSATVHQLKSGVAFKELNLKCKQNLVSLITLDEHDWAAVAPDGRFDTNKNLSDNIEGLHWIFPDRPLMPLSFNIFMRDYYEPRLLSRLMKGEKLPPLPSLEELNRLQPHVGKITVLPQAFNPDLVDVKVEIASVAGQCVRGNKDRPCESGIYDLRLYRDGQLVGQSPDSLTKSFNSSLSKQNRQEQLREWRGQSVVKTVGRSAKVAKGKHEVTFNNIRLPKRGDLAQVKFTAYAFNEDRVKSETSAPISFTFPSPRKAAASQRAYLITIGVDATSARNWRLLFAPNGARDIEKFLKDMLQAKYEIVPVQLISEFHEDGLGFKQNLATKNNIQTVLNILSGREVKAAQREPIPNQDKLRAATPDDLVILYIASHGYADPRGVFYTIPSDLGTSAETVSVTLLNRCLTTAEQSENCQAARSFLEHSISSDELTEWIETIDAGEMTLILDSCHSAAVSGPNFKPGPMGDRSFGQLSYDKGMRVLAATQVENVAFGTLALNDRSLLTHVLTREKDAPSFTMESWLGGAEKAVPELYKELLASVEGQPQEPIFFNFVRN